MEVTALQQVVGEDLSLGKTALQTGVKGLYIKNSLAGIAALVKEVVVHIAGRPAVGVHTPKSPKHPGKERPVGRLQLHTHPGLEQAIAGGNDFPFLVHHRPVHGVEHGPRQRPGRAHRQAGVGI